MTLYELRDVWERERVIAFYARKERRPEDERVLRVRTSITYLNARKEFMELGQVMGLERMVIDE